MDCCVGVYQLHQLSGDGLDCFMVEVVAFVGDTVDVLAEVVEECFVVVVGFFVDVICIVDLVGEEEECELDVGCLVLLDECAKEEEIHVPSALVESSVVGCFASFLCYPCSCSRKLDCSS